MKKLWDYCLRLGWLFLSPVVWDEWIPPTNYFDFITPGIYKWAASIKNAYFTNSVIIRESGVGFEFDKLEEERREQVEKLNELIATWAEKKMEVKDLFKAGDFAGALHILANYHLPSK